MNALLQRHRETYPEQYTHPLVGKQMRTRNNEVITVERVVPSRFGPLAISREHGPSTAWGIGTLTEAPHS